jgi:hypothetical protein
MPRYEILKKYNKKIIQNKIYILKIIGGSIQHETNSKSWNLK